MLQHRVEISCANVKQEISTLLRLLKVSYYNSQKIFMF
jgi:hypothetical protein